ncbi:MAG: glycoside hydrolase family 16 protein [Candidatus Limnocylindrales bacterium]
MRHQRRSTTRRGTRWLTTPIALVVLLATASTTLAAGKPGYPDKVTWSGESWAIKTSRSPVGPGPNVFAKSNVSVDAQGRLHLRIAKDAAGAWTTAEIIGPRTYGYGTYTFTIESAVDDLDPNVVLGLFTWSDRARYAHREIDIEFARWGDAADPTNAQFVVQPHDIATHLHRFTQPAGTPTTHRFSWRPGRIDWESRDAAGTIVAAFTYTGSDVPPSGDERVRLNLWLFNGASPTDGQPVEVVIRSFTFTPLA